MTIPKAKSYPNQLKELNTSPVEDEATNHVTITEDEILAIPAVQSLLENGYGQDIVLKSFYVKCKETPLEFIRAEDLLQTVWDLETKTKDVIKRLREENRHLKELLTCKICMDKPLCIVFLPCRHLVTCTNCASMMRICPMCRGCIEENIKVIFC